MHLPRWIKHGHAVPSADLAAEGDAGRTAPRQLCKALKGHQASTLPSSLLARQEQHIPLLLNCCLSQLVDLFEEPGWSRWSHLHPHTCRLQLHLKKPGYLGQVAQRGFGCPILGQVGQGLGKPGVVNGISAHGRGMGMGWPSRSFQPKPSCHSLSCTTLCRPPH